MCFLSAKKNERDVTFHTFTIECQRVFSVLRIGSTFGRFSINNILIKSSEALEKMMIRVVCKFYDLFAGSRDISCLGSKNSWLLFVYWLPTLRLHFVPQLFMRGSDNATHTNNITCWQPPKLCVATSVVKWQPICWFLHVIRVVVTLKKSRGARKLWN